MQRDNQRFCPLIQGDCRRDCQWCDTVIDLSEDGASETLVCAVMGIYAQMLVEDEWFPDDCDMPW